jgi:hypothetical protein
MNKMSLKAREFGKEITNASSDSTHTGAHPSSGSGMRGALSSGNSMFSSTMMHHHHGVGGPLSVKHADISAPSTSQQQHFHQIVVHHPSKKGAHNTSGESSTATRAGSSGIPEHLMLSQHTSHIGSAAPKMMMVRER